MTAAECGRVTKVESPSWGTTTPGLSRRGPGTHRWPKSGWTLAQATKAKLLEAGPFHQALKTRVERYFQEMGRSQRDLHSHPNGVGLDHVRWLKRMGRPVVVEAV